MLRDSIHTPASPRAAGLLLVVTTLGLSFVTAFLACMGGPLNFGLSDNETVPAQGDELRDQAIRVDTFHFDTKATLTLPDGGLLEFRYGPISDSGVQLRRLDRPGGSVLWEQECSPLGVGHSEYSHEAFVLIEGATAKVISRGSYGIFVERLDLETGKRLARSVRRRYSND